MTITDGKDYYFQGFGDTISNYSGRHYATGRPGDIQGNLIIDNLNDLKIGDFYELDYYQNGYTEWGYKCKKIIPSEEDLKQYNNHRKYVEEVAKNGGAFLKDLLEYSRETIIKRGKEDLDILLSPEQISKLVEKFIFSIITYGVSGSGAEGIVFFQRQMGRNNLFDEEGMNYRNLFGFDESPFMKSEYPSCVPADISSKIYVDGKAGDPKNGGSRFIAACGDMRCTVNIDQDGVTVVPYIPGSLKEALEAKIKKH